MPVLLNPVICNSNLIKTIKRIDYLRYREDIELLSTAYARSTATNLVIGAANSNPDHFFQPWISGDELGGVRVVWWRLKPHAQVRLIVPPTPSKRIAIYCEIREEFNLDFDVSSKILGQYLEWIYQIANNEIDTQKLGCGDSEYSRCLGETQVSKMQYEHGAAYRTDWDN